MHAGNIHVPLSHTPLPFESIPYLWGISTVLVLPVFLSSLPTQGNTQQTPVRLEVIFARNIIRTISVPCQTTVVKVTSPTLIQTILSIANIAGMESICGNVVRAAATHGSQMTGISEPARGTETRHSKYLHGTAQSMPLMKATR